MNPICCKVYMGIIHSGTLICNISKIGFFHFKPKAILIHIQIVEGYLLIQSFNKITKYLLCFMDYSTDELVTVLPNKNGRQPVKFKLQVNTKCSNGDTYCKN